ncbi:AbrB/MazE/SpoVT family DNA-binding domain-containing protein [Thermaerobacter litoralis]
MAIVKILQRGQMTLPKAIRERVGLEEGDDVLVYVNGEGEIVLYPLPRPRSLKELGSVLKIDRPVDTGEAREAIRASRARRWGEKQGVDGAGTEALAQAAVGRESAEDRVRE